jgi:predicted O-linked N-acetylglucosamine transferase (SPINDLY family)
LLDKAKQAYKQAVKFNPRHAPAWHALGVMAAQADNATTGLELLFKALAIEPQNPVYLTNASNALIALNRFDEAKKLCQQALQIKPDYTPALRNQGVASIKLMHYPEALECFDKALQINPDLDELLLLLANTLLDLKAYDDAIAAADRLLALQPNSFDAHLCKANALNASMRYEQSLDEFDAAVTLQPHHAIAWLLRGSALEFAERYADAVQSYNRAMVLDPNLPFITGALLHAKMLCCDWSDLQDLYANVIAKVHLKISAIFPFGYQAICDQEASLYACAKFASQDKYPALASAYVHPAWPPHSKIRLGYLCGEFREHATSILLTEVWEHHDKDQFEIFAFDNGWNDTSPRRARINQAFDHVIDISLLPDREAAALIHAHQIDILINLNGFFGRERNKIFSMRPSPVQVNYLGFPGTMGAPYIDYLIADDTVIPPSSQRHYSEKVVYLPGCYQPNDTQRLISSHVFSRDELSLPEQGFVFCCFNNNYKITPTTFDVWMRILTQVPGSVLWLLQDTPEAAANLQREALQRGIDTQRLVFAPRMPNDEHLARHAMADLFLDTWPYNAHTTASDALWAGLPLLTIKGNSFPGRVASSLLCNLHLPELITEDVKSYEAMAVRLATDPNLLSALRSRLNSVKHDSTPFKPAQHAKELEALYLDMMKHVY